MDTERYKLLGGYKDEILEAAANGDINTIIKKPWTYYHLLKTGVINDHWVFLHISNASNHWLEKLVSQMRYSIALVKDYSPTNPNRHASGWLISDDDVYRMLLQIDHIVNLELNIREFGDSKKWGDEYRKSKADLIKHYESIDAPNPLQMELI